MSFDPVKLQDQSSGVLPDSDKGASIRCEHYQDNVAGKAEKYVYRLLIVILVVCFLLVILLLFVILNYCCNRKNRRVSEYQSVSTLKTNGNGDKDAVFQSASTPKVEVYKKQAKPPPPPSLPSVIVDPFGKNTDSMQQQSRSNGDGTSGRQRNNQQRQEQATVLTDIESGTGDESDAVQATRDRNCAGTQRFVDSRRTATNNNVTVDRFGSKILPFEPSPMEESFENVPRPIPITYHDRSEIGSSTERRPLVTSRSKPEEQKARLVYYKSEASRSEKFNEHAEYDDDY
uniref:Uncharacterized protein n=1 Tax=Romanomermis culicivorax TaxID=13658 RepID=A0A915HS78_ROMCU